LFVFFHDVELALGKKGEWRLIHHAFYGRRESHHVKFGILQNRKLDSPGDGCHVGFLEHQLANPLPMQT
jgi:hypothetical protein